MKKGNAKKSIADSLTRIIKYNYKDIAEDQIIVARVVSVNSDILVPDTFGTMDCYDEKNQIDIFEVPLNAHINDDGTTGISGKYTFPKVGSDIFLVADIRANKEVFIPILFSHIDSVFEQYNIGKTTKIVGVDTADENKPYDTEETGDYSQIEQTHEKNISTVGSQDNNGGSSRSQEYDSIGDLVQSGSDASSRSQELSSISDSINGNSGQTSRSFELDSIIDSIQGNAGVSNHTQTNSLISNSVKSMSTGQDLKIDIDTSEINISSGVVGVTPEPAVMGDTLVDIITQILTQIKLITVTAPSGVTTVPLNVAAVTSIEAQLQTILNTKIKLS